MTVFNCICAGICILIGVILLLVQVIRKNRKLFPAVTATIIDSIPGEKLRLVRHGAFVEHVYYPLIEYEVNGKVYHGKGSSYSLNPKSYQKGDAINIGVSRYDPNHIVMFEDNGSVKNAIVFIACGILLVLYALIK